MANAKELIEQLAVLSGIKIDNEALVKASQALSEIELDDEISNSIKSNLLTRQSAINNSTIVNEIKAPLFNAIDAKFAEQMELHKFTDDEKQKVNGNGKNTYDKLKLFNDIVNNRHEQALSSNKGEVDVEGIKKQYQSQYDTLFKENEGLKGANNDLLTKHQNDIKNLHVKTILAGYKYPSAYSTEDGALLGMHKLEKALISDGVSIVGENGNYTLKHGNLEYMVDNKKVELKPYIDTVLANNNLLAVKEPAITTPSPTIQPTNTGSGMENYLRKMDEAIEGSQTTVG